MKKILSITLAILMLTVCFIPSYAANSTLSVSADKTSADVGDTITVTVSISANSGLGGLDFNLNYDTNCFQYVSSSSSALFEMPLILGQEDRLCISTKERLPQQKFSLL